jgi:hypothetical protein
MRVLRAIAASRGVGPAMDAPVERVVLVQRLREVVSRWPSHDSSRRHRILRSIWTWDSGERLSVARSRGVKP